MVIGWEAGIRTPITLGLEGRFVDSPAGILTETVLWSQVPQALDLSFRSFPIVLQSRFGAGNRGEAIQSL